MFSKISVSFQTVKMRLSVFAVALVVFLALQASPARSFNIAQFQQESLNAHNELRRRHGVPDLQLSATISAVAQEWANKLASEDKIYHRPNNKYGENLYWVSGGNPGGYAATKAFYDEIKDYNFDNGGFSMATGHFTNLVWRGNKYVGIGVARSQKGGLYYVANYDPKGNYGDFEANVPRPIY